MKILHSSGNILLCVRLFIMLKINCIITLDEKALLWQLHLRSRSDKVIDHLKMSDVIYDFWINKGLYEET
jgi:hypothetical protein